jgi:hypothetical protein
VQPPAHHLLQCTLASGKQNCRNLPLVASAAIAADIAVRLESID